MVAIYWRVGLPDVNDRILPLNGAKATHFLSRLLASRGFDCVLNHLGTHAVFRGGYRVGICKLSRLSYRRVGGTR